jgi:hypothetical protein
MGSCFAAERCPEILARSHPPSKVAHRFNHTLLCLLDKCIILVEKRKEKILLLAPPGGGVKTLLLLYLAASNPISRIYGFFSRSLESNYLESLAMLFGCPREHASPITKSYTRAKSD